LVCVPNHMYLCSQAGAARAHSLMMLEPNLLGVNPQDCKDRKLVMVVASNPNQLSFADVDKNQTK